MPDRLWESEGPDPSQNRRGRRHALAEWLSSRRLAAVFAEEDAEIAARLGEETMVENGLQYRFKCRFCESRFSLEQQRDAHEEQCGFVEAPVAKPQEAPSTSANGHRPIICKRCEYVSPGLKEHSAHLLEAHREETLAHRRQLADHRKAEDTRIDAGAAPAGKVCKRCGYRAENFGALGRHMRQEHPEAYRNHSQPAAAPATRATGTPGEQPVHATGNGHCCPTCGGQVPETTAALLVELRTLGLSEEQAFAASRAARRILGAGAVA